LDGKPLQEATTLKRRGWLADQIKTLIGAGREFVSAQADGNAVETTGGD